MLLNDLKVYKNFLEEKGHKDAATDTNSLISSVVRMFYTVSNSTCRTTITEFF